MSELFPTEVWKARAHKGRQYRSFFQYITYQRIGLFTAISDFALIVTTSIAIGVVYSFFVLETEGNVATFAFLGGKRQLRLKIQIDLWVYWRSPSRHSAGWSRSG